MTLRTEQIASLATKRTQLAEVNTTLNSILESQLKGYEYENGISGQRQKASNLEIKSLRELITSLEYDISVIVKQLNKNPMVMNIRNRRRP
jgi:hypothetical protein